MQNIVKNVVEIVKENFPNGIRDDFIDTNKVLRIYRTNHADENISRNFIAEIIRANGIEDGGRFYFISDDNAENIRQFLDEILSANSIAYYAKIHEKHSDFFAAMHIFSPDVLRKILQTIGGNFYFPEFCSARRATRLDYVVAKIFTAAENSLSLDDLQEKLPYVPPEKILAVLSDVKKYLPTSAGKFIPFSRIQFDTDEINDAKKQISRHIEKDGYALPEDYSLVSNFALNPELAEKDLRNIIYEKFFAEDFTRRGKKLSGKGDDGRKKSSGVVERIREFIADKNEVAVKDIFALDETLNDKPSVVFYAAYETMIRVDKNFFVKDELINFDVVGVDDALTSFVQGKIISLRGVTSFTGFPPVAGYSWNLFLLESFLRKSSRKYSFHNPAPNSANVGAIYLKSLKFEDYLDVQAAVVVQEKIPLEKSAVEEFLVRQGFRANRIAKVTERIIARAGNLQSVKN